MMLQNQINSAPLNRPNIRYEQLDIDRKVNFKNYQEYIANQETSRFQLEPITH